MNKKKGKQQRCKGCASTTGILTTERGTFPLLTISIEEQMFSDTTVIKTPNDAGYWDAQGYQPWTARSPQAQKAAQRLLNGCVVSSIYDSAPSTPTGVFHPAAYIAPQVSTHRPASIATTAMATADVVALSSPGGAQSPCVRMHQPQTRSFTTISCSTTSAGPTFFSTSPVNLHSHRASPVVVRDAWAVAAATSREDGRYRHRAKPPAPSSRSEGGCSSLQQQGRASTAPAMMQGTVGSRSPMNSHRAGHIKRSQLRSPQSNLSQQPLYMIEADEDARKQANKQSMLFTSSGALASTLSQPSSPCGSPRKRAHNPVPGYGPGHILASVDMLAKDAQAYKSVVGPTLTRTSSGLTCTSPRWGVNPTSTSDWALLMEPNKQQLMQDLDHVTQLMRLPAPAHALLPPPTPQNQARPPTVRDAAAMPLDPSVLMDVSDPWALSPLHDDDRLSIEFNVDVLPFVQDLFEQSAALHPADVTARSANRVTQHAGRDEHAAVRECSLGRCTTAETSSTAEQPEMHTYTSNTVQDSNDQLSTSPRARSLHVSLANSMGSGGHLHQPSPTSRLARQTGRNMHDETGSSQAANSPRSVAAIRATELKAEDSKSKQVGMGNAREYGQAASRSVNVRSGNAVHPNDHQQVVSSVQLEPSFAHMMTDTAHVAVGGDVSHGGLGAASGSTAADSRISSNTYETVVSEISVAGFLATREESEQVLHHDHGEYSEQHAGVDGMVVEEFMADYESVQSADPDMHEQAAAVNSPQQRQQLQQGMYIPVSSPTASRGLMARVTSEVVRSSAADLGGENHRAARRRHGSMSHIDSQAARSSTVGTGSADLHKTRSRRAGGSMMHAADMQRAGSSGEPPASRTSNPPMSRGSVASWDTDQDDVHAFRDAHSTHSTQDEDVSPNLSQQQGAVTPNDMKEDRPAVVVGGGSMLKASTSRSARQQAPRNPVQTSGLSYTVARSVVAPLKSKTDLDEEDVRQQLQQVVEGIDEERTSQRTSDASRAAKALRKMVDVGASLVGGVAQAAPNATQPEVVSMLRITSAAPRTSRVSGGGVANTVRPAALPGAVKPTTVPSTAKLPKIVTPPTPADYRHKKGLTEIGTAHMQDIWA